MQKLDPKDQYDFYITISLKKKIGKLEKYEVRTDLGRTLVTVYPSLD